MNTTFSITNALSGGALIGLAAVLLLVFNGRIAGISGICSAVLKPHLPDNIWRIVFLAGMLGGAYLFPLLTGKVLDVEISSSWPLLITSGLLVGFGTRLGGGCTSGHGVCGLARLSKRSLTSTLLFMGVAMITATSIFLLKGGV